MNTYNCRTARLCKTITESQVYRCAVEDRDEGKRFRDILPPASALGQMKFFDEQRSIGFVLRSLAAEFRPSRPSKVGSSREEWDKRPERTIKKTAYLFPLQLVNH